MRSAICVSFVLAVYSTALAQTTAQPSPQPAASQPSSAAANAENGRQFTLDCTGDTILITTPRRGDTANCGGVHELQLQGANVWALLRFAAKHRFLKDALYGLASTALSDYRQLRSRVGLQRYGEDDIIKKLAAAGFAATRARRNIGHNPWRMTFVARHAHA